MDAGLFVLDVNAGLLSSIRLGHPTIRSKALAGFIEAGSPSAPPTCMAVTAHWVSLALLIPFQVKVVGLTLLPLRLAKRQGRSGTAARWSSSSLDLVFTPPVEVCVRCGLPSGDVCRSASGMTDIFPGIPSETPEGDDCLLCKPPALLGYCRLKLLLMYFPSRHFLGV